MRKWVIRGLAFGLTLLVSLSVCDFGCADDTKTGNDSKPAAVKPAESKPEAGLTNRERWLLERVEQLEKRGRPGVKRGEAGGGNSGASPGRFE